MYQRIILSKYRLEDFAPLVENIVGVLFTRVDSNRDGDKAFRLIGSSEGRLFLMYDAKEKLPPVLRKIVEGVPEMEVRSIFVALYSESVFSKVATIESDVAYDSNQIMLNFADDERALTVVSLEDTPREGTRQIKALYETWTSSINYETGARSVRPSIREVDLDLSGLLPL